MYNVTNVIKIQIKTQLLMSYAHIIICDLKKFLKGYVQCPLKMSCDIVCDERLLG